MHRRKAEVAVGARRTWGASSARTPVVEINRQAPIIALRRRLIQRNAVAKERWRLNCLPCAGNATFKKSAKGV